MPRTARLDAPGLVHHVIARGIERRRIFFDDQDYNYFVKKLESVLIDAASPCYAWILLSNHFHLAIRTNNVPLSKIMHRLLGGYALYFNRRHKRSGHLFQNRYKSIVVDEDGYLTALVSYIHLNPIRAGLVKDINKLIEYKWSGHVALMGEINYGWQDTKFVLDFFGGKKSYLKYLASQNNKEVVDLDGGGLRRSLQLKEGEQPKKEDSGAIDARILGSNEYANYLLEKFESKSPKPVTQRLKRLLVSVCEHYDITEQALKGRLRARKLSEARGVLAALAVASGFSYAEIARELNLTNPAVIKAAKRGNSILNTSPEMKTELKVN